MGELGWEAGAPSSGLCASREPVECRESADVCIGPDSRGVSGRRDGLCELLLPSRGRSAARLGVWLPGPPRPNALTPVPGAGSPVPRAHQPPGAPPALRALRAPFLAALRLPRWDGRVGACCLREGGSFSVIYRCPLLSPPHQHGQLDLSLSLQKTGQARQNSDKLPRAGSGAGGRGSGLSPQRWPSADGRGARRLGPVRWGLHHVRPVSSGRLASSWGPGRPQYLGCRSQFLSSPDSHGAEELVLATKGRRPVPGTAPRMRGRRQSCGASVPPGRPGGAWASSAPAPTK